MRVLRRFDRETTSRIVEALQKGYAIGDACDLANIDRDTYYAWLRYASEEDAPEELAEFARQVRAARANASTEIQDILRVHMGSERGATACLEWLKRQRREDWGDARQPEGSLAEAIAAADEPKKLTDAEKLQRINALIPRMLAEKARIESQEDAIALPSGNTETGNGG